MSESFARKAIYLALIAGLLLPVSFLSQPATIGLADRPATPGGVLAQQRDKLKLAQANLGKIDPTSEAIKLATLGMRGIAANILWAKADEAKVKEDWTGLSATLEQIANLQPNYISVWRFQGWNLSYNISAEWDDYRDRYYWVIRGIEFLQKGVAYNQHEPRLLTDVGWFTSQKIGRADEHLQYRRLFRDDDEFHRHQHVHQRDNWLFGKAYFVEAERVVDDLGLAVPTAGPAIFYSRPSLAEMNYAAALEDDHRQALDDASSLNAEPSSAGGKRFVERLADIDHRYARLIRQAWEVAAREWAEFGRRELPGSTGEPLRLNDMEHAAHDADALLERLLTMAPGAERAIYAEKVARLPEEQRKALSIKPENRTRREAELADAAEMACEVSSSEIAARVPSEQRAAARELAAEVDRQRQRAFEIATSRESVNFDYWHLRAEMERSADALEARRELHRGMAALTIEADLATAKRDLEAAFALWKKVLDRYPRLATDQTAYDILDGVRAYRFVLGQLDEPFPKNFPLKALVEANESAF